MNATPFQAQRDQSLFFSRYAALIRQPQLADCEASAFSRKFEIADIERFAAATT
ncbi:hypothetical protein [Sphingopyxis sp.]|uniref:hypothetical protein n=1 Tax=Sphingopyxis sp. TaxID=1908224 RepID=UPI003D122EAD